MSNSEKHTVSNLLNNDDFIVWISSNFKTNNQYWIRIQSNLNPEDTKTFNIAKNILVKLNTLEVNDSSNQKSQEFINHQFDRLLKASNTPSEVKKIHPFKFSNLLKYAAAMVLLFAVSSLFFFSENSGYQFTDNLAEISYNTSDILIQTPENKYYKINANTNKQWIINNSIKVEVTGKKISFISTNGGVSEDNQNFKIFVPQGKHFQLNLIDGTEIDLKSNTTLTFNNSTISKKRSVDLLGEAVFNVAHNKERPFIVQSSDMKIEALGTIFNVSNYSENNYTSTTLIDGSIKVSNPQGENETIKPGYQVKFFHNQNRLIINNVNAKKKISSNAIQKNKKVKLITKETQKSPATI